MAMNQSKVSTGTPWPFPDMKPVETEAAKRERRVNERIEARAFELVHCSFSFEGRDVRMDDIRREAQWQPATIKVHRGSKQVEIANPLHFTEQELATEAFVSGVERAYEEISGDWPEGFDYPECGDLI